MTYVTKYFSADALEFIGEGCFRFGSLAKYRGDESALLDSSYARFQDRTDGMMVGHANYTGSGKVDFFGIKDDPFDEDSLISVQENDLEYRVNAYVFCSSLGGYDNAHHEIMRSGNGSDYAGNSDLTEYAVLDTRRFLRAIDAIHPDNPVVLMEPAEVSVDCAPVQYREKSITVKRTSAGLVYPEEKLKWEAVFWKDPCFAVEREFRIVLRNFSSRFIKYSKDYADISAPGLKDSIVELGSIRQPSF